jgi:hypothetical protein
MASASVTVKFMGWVSYLVLISADGVTGCLKPLS